MSAPSILTRQLLCLLLCLSVLTSVAADPIKLTLGAENSWPPFSDARGEGISIRIVEAAFAAVGIEVDIEVYPYARVLHLIESGALAGGFNVTRQASTEALFVFGDSPILQASTSYYYKAGSEHSYSSVADMPVGTRVGLIIDYEYGDDFERSRQHINEIRVSRQEQLLLMLASDRLDVAILFDQVADATLARVVAQSKNNFTANAISRGASHHTSDIYVAFSKKRPDAQALAQALDRGLAIIKADGRYARALLGD